MEYKTTPGRKGPKDKILWIKTSGNDGWEAIKLRQWLKIARFKGEVEDAAYPYPHEGRYRLLRFLNDGLRKVNGIYKNTISEICKKHQIED